jgi:hypothetical protein
MAGRSATPVNGGDGIDTFGGRLKRSCLVETKSPSRTVAESAGRERQGGCSRKPFKSHLFFLHLCKEIQECYAGPRAPEHNCPTMADLERLHDQKYKPALNIR